MGIFSRLSDIISSNLNAMLDRAENPEKMIRLMIQEMEDTLVEVKASCAGAIASKKKVERLLEEVKYRADEWERKAGMAIEKGREDLARDALKERHSALRRADALEEEKAELEAIVDRYRADIAKLEAKLSDVRERQRVLVQRHIHAQKRKRSEEGIRRADTSDALLRFEQFEDRVARMEAEAELVNPPQKPDLEEAIENLELSDKIEKELEALKKRVKGDKV